MDFNLTWFLFVCLFVFSSLLGWVFFLFVLCVSVCLFVFNFAFVLLLLLVFCFFFCLFCLLVKGEREGFFFSNFEPGVLGPIDASQVMIQCV